MGRGEQPLRMAQRFFLLYVLLQVWGQFPQAMDLEIEGFRPLSALLIVAAIGALRIVEYRRKAPLPLWMDSLEGVALVGVSVLLGTQDSLQPLLFAMAQFRSVLASLSRLLTIVAVFVMLSVVPTAVGLTDSPVDGGAVIGLIVSPMMAYTVRILMLRGQRELAQQRMLLEEVLSRMPSAIVVTDTDGAVTFANPTATRITGMSVGSDASGLDKLSLKDLNGTPVTLAVATRGGDTHLENTELELVRDDGERRRVVVDVQPLAEQIPGASGVLVEVRDITDQRRYEEHLHHLASHDTLTGLPNRLMYQQLAAAVADSGEPYAVMLIDLNDFKAVNDTLGHHAGDELLQGVAQRLRQHADPTATVARLGGDEFAVLLPGADETTAAAAAARLTAAFNAPFGLSTGPLQSHGSVGYALAAPGESARDALGRADMAMYARKQEWPSSHRAAPTLSPAIN
ncbi:diguanylate cyclase [Actinoplanes sp. NPDC049548]|uniref:diguanylate cyclase domain-containing protein n=1 Tax=Actinoplanes sp. NPDC049548 TaxID=3155152 RepID=UPI00342B8F53